MKRKTKPLAGQHVLVTRTLAQSAELVRPLRALGAKVTAIPTIEIRQPRSLAPLDRALQKLDRYDWLIVTSVNGVAALRHRMRKLRLGVDNLGRLRVAAIGPATRRAMEQLGLRVTVMPHEYVAEGVVAVLRKKKVDKQRVLLVRAQVARDVMPRELRRAGARVDVVAAYQTVAPRASRARLRALFRGSRRPTVIAFTSSSTARNFAALAGDDVLYSGQLDGVRFASIGPVTSRTLRALGLTPDIEARDYTMEGLVRAIQDDCVIG